MANKWRKFDQGVSDCYTAMITGRHGIEPWEKTFVVFRSILEDIRSEDETFACTIEELEDATDWDHDFSGWLEDYLDELDMYKQYRKLLDSVEYLLQEFDWPDDELLGLRFHKAESLWELGKTDEAVSFCGQWMESEPEDVSAKAAYIYACSHKGNYQDAWKMVDDFALSWDQSDEDLYVLYIAIDRLCDATGNQETKENVQKLIAECDERFEVELEEWMEDDALDEDFELPFN